MKFAPKFFQLFSFVLIFSLTSCSWFEDSGTSSNSASGDAKAFSKSAEDLYREAKEKLSNANYPAAVRLFQEIERLYPFSDLAPRSRVMTAFAYYKDEEYEKAIDVIDNFVALNPGNKDIDFMYYLKATSYYDRISDVERDQEVTENARSAFKELIRRHPSSKYSKDAKYKIDLIRDHLAGKEMEIGRFYLEQKKYIAALNRFKQVLKDFEDTPQIEEALYRLVETNLILGLDEEAVKYAAVLGYNYPSGKWYRRAYNLVEKGESASAGNRFMEFFGFDNKIGSIRLPGLHSDEATDQQKELIDGSIQKELN
jgi:outer membrane protein assembly factor BamD